MSELVTIFILAFAVSMDAFSFAIGIGKKSMPIGRMVFITVTIGFLHIIMPLFGMVIGHYFSGLFHQILHYISGIILISVGVSMLIEGVKRSNYIDDGLKTTTIIVLSFVISLDSFSAALSLGLVHMQMVKVIFMFGMVATILTWTGFFLGRKVKFLLGSYGELFGSFVLIFLGVRIIIA